MLKNDNINTIEYGVNRVISDKVILKLVFPHRRENELRIIASKNEN